MFLKALEHFTGETHWFASKTQGVQVPVELEGLLQQYVYKYGWSQSVVELKDTGNYATESGYESLARFVENHHQTLLDSTNAN